MCQEGLASSLLDAMVQPFPMVQRVLELRAYARAKAAVDDAEDDADLPEGPMAELVFTNMKRALDEGRQV